MIGLKLFLPLPQKVQVNEIFTILHGPVLDELPLTSSDMGDILAPQRNVIDGSNFIALPARAGWLHEQWDCPTSIATRACRL